MIIYETEKLALREFSNEDAVQLYLLNLDPDVIKYTGDKSFDNIAEAKLFLENYDHYQKYGYGRWAVLNKPDHEFLGWCGLKYTPELNEVDIGFRFFKKHWNKGYATQTAKICIELGFNKYGMTTIVGRTRKENFGSVRVLEKIGLTFSKSINFEGKEGLLFKIEKNSDQS